MAAGSGPTVSYANASEYEGVSIRSTREIVGASRVPSVHVRLVCIPNVGLWFASSRNLTFLIKGPRAKANSPVGAEHGASKLG